MKRASFFNGFSLVEILIGLFIVSLTAVNISALQQMVCDQSRDNFSHATVIHLVSENLEKVMQYTDLSDVDSLHDTSETESQRGSDFEVSWKITGTGDSVPIRDVAITVTWSDAAGATQAFTYSEEVSFLMLSTGAGAGEQSEFPYTIAGLLGTDNINYFDSTASYQTGDYVVYDNQLFQATSASVSNKPIDSTGVNTSWVQVKDEE